MPKIAKKCSVYGCDNLSVAKGFCDMHRKRMENHGHVLSTRPSDWGSREKHPLYASWVNLRRCKKLPNEWADFWIFVQTVGEKPSDKHRIVVVDRSKPIGPGNWGWQEPLLSAEEAGDHAKYMREYTQKRRALDPAYQFSLSLRRYYGITLEEYLAMHDAQNGVCSICKRPEQSVDPKTTKVRRLAVDHCHGKGHVRALLCSKCNAGLGHFQDNIESLERAIDYLRRHSG